MFVTCGPGEGRMGMKPSGRSRVGGRAVLSGHWALGRSMPPSLCGGAEWTWLFLSHKSLRGGEFTKWQEGNSFRERDPLLKERKKLGREREMGRGLCLLSRT